jgi:hypothetical protein
MTEYYIVAQSFAAPFFSDTSTHWIVAECAEHAINKLRDQYKHPAGLFAALCYLDANAQSKGEKPLAKWLCNHEAEKERLTKDLGSYSYRGEGPGKFQIDGEWHTVENPKGGRFVTV